MRRRQQRRQEQSRSSQEETSFASTQGNCQYKEQCMENCRQLTMRPSSKVRPGTAIYSARKTEYRKMLLTRKPIHQAASGEQLKVGC
jgi:hypothetical protein